MPRSFGSQDSDHADRPDRRSAGARSSKSEKGAKGAKGTKGERGRKGRSGGFERDSQRAPAERGGSPLRAGFGASLEAASFAAGSPSGEGAATHRVAQVSALICRVLRERLSRGINDPRVQGMVSIVGVDCTSDLAAAAVRVSVLPAERGRLTLSGLKSATRHLEGIIRKATRLRRVPKLLFELDDSMKREAALTESLNAIRKSTAGEPPNHRTPDGDERPANDDSTP